MSWIPYRGQLEKLTVASSPLYAGLPSRGHRAAARWLVRGDGPLEVTWDAGRGGRGVARG